MLVFALFLIADGPASLPVGDWRVTRFTVAPEVANDFTPPLAAEIAPKGDLVVRVLAEDDGRVVARRYVGPTRGQPLSYVDPVQLAYRNAWFGLTFDDNDNTWAWPLDTTRRLRRIDADHYALEGEYLGEHRNLRLPGTVTYLERFDCTWCDTFQRDEEQAQREELIAASAASEQWCTKKKNAGACEDLAMDFYHGARGRSVDKKKAVELFTRACNGGLVIDCLNAANMHDDDKRYKQAIPLYQKACASKAERTGEGCHKLGIYFVEGNGVKVDYKKALAADLEACNRGHAISCSNAAEIFLDHHDDRKRAAELFSRGCELGDDYSCEHKDP